MNQDQDLKFSIEIEATPEEIFPYFVESELMLEWIGNAAELDPHPGGVFRLDFEETSTQGKYVAVEPPHRVVFTWGAAGNEAFQPGSSTVEVVLKPDGDQTIVELTHSGLPADWIEPHTRGWKKFLGELVRAAGRNSRKGAR